MTGGPVGGVFDEPLPGHGFETIGGPFLSRGLLLLYGARWDRSPGPTAGGLARAGAVLLSETHRDRRLGRSVSPYLQSGILSATTCRRWGYFQI